jgi:hypothetical protein
VIFFWQAHVFLAPNPKFVRQPAPLQTAQTLCAVTVHAFFITRSGLVLTYLTNMLIMMDR